MKTAAKGDPSTIAASAAPTTCPLTPPGITETGRAMLSVWMAKMPAARTATRGTFSSLISFFAHRSERRMKTRAMIQYTAA